jgi:PAS domain S-box-containing protein
VGLDPLTLLAVLRSADDAIVTETLNGIVTSWNPAAERLFGYAAREMIGRPSAVLCPPDRADEPARVRRVTVGGQRVEPLETVRVRKDGSLVDVSVTLSPIADEHGRLLGISTIARDVTTRRRAEAELRAHERLLRITLASIGDAIITVDAEGRVTFLNPVAEQLTGWCNADAIGAPLDEVFRIVNEKTGGRAENPVGRVLRRRASRRPGGRPRRRIA